MSGTHGHGASVRIENCGKTFADGTRALEPATLDIARGETLVLLGPSGCGKTTMLRIIAGLETPDAGGKVLFDGKDMTKVPIEKRNVGMVFQSYALFPNMSVAENIGYGLKIRGVPKEERAARVAELVALTNIAGLENRRIDQLSGGQRQRVALARAVAIRPGILLLDEPLTALDAALRERLRSELNRLLACARHHRDLRDPRSVRSDGARRPHRGHEQGRDRADRHAARHLFHAAQSLRRRVHRRGEHHRSAGRERPSGVAGRAAADRRARSIWRLRSPWFVRNRSVWWSRAARRFPASSTASASTATGSGWSSAAPPIKPLDRRGIQYRAGQGRRARRPVDRAGSRPSVAAGRLRTMTSKPHSHRADFRPAYQAAGYARLWPASIRQRRWNDASRR